MPFIIGGGLKNYLNNRLGQDKWAPLERLKKYSWIQSSKTNILRGKKSLEFLKRVRGSGEREHNHLHLITFTGCYKGRSYMKTKRAFSSSDTDSSEFHFSLYPQSRFFFSFLCL